MSFILSKMNNYSAVAKANSFMCARHMESNKVATFVSLIILKIVSANNEYLRKL